MTDLPEPNIGAPFLEGETNRLTPFWHRFLALVFVRLGGEVGGTTIWGEGDPEGRFVANRGTDFRRINGGAGTCFYIKESGDGTPNGWVAK